MKKIIFKAVLLASTLPIASAIAAPNNVGCGLGSTIFEGESGLVKQVLAVTTNGTSGNQTFGISIPMITWINWLVIWQPVKVKRSIPWLH